MTEQTRGGLFPANPLDFALLLRRPPNPPRVPTKEEVRADPFLRTIAARQKELEFELMRVHLASAITSTLYDDMVAVADEAFGTESTRKTYKSDFNRYARWCEEQHLPSLPTAPEVTAHFLLHLGKTVKPGGIDRMIQAIAYHHRWARQPFDPDDEIIRATVRFLRRCHQEAKSEGSAAATPLPVEREQISTNGQGGPH
jgi:hypothetical protein